MTNQVTGTFELNPVFVLIKNMSGFIEFDIEHVPYIKTRNIESSHPLASPSVIINICACFSEVDVVFSFNSIGCCPVNAGVFSLVFCDFSEWNKSLNIGQFFGCIHSAVPFVFSDADQIDQVSNPITRLGFFCNGINSSRLNPVSIIQVGSDEVAVYQYICIVYDPTSIMRQGFAPAEKFLISNDEFLVVEFCISKVSIDW